MKNKELQTGKKNIHNVTCLHASKCDTVEKNKKKTTKKQNDSNNNNNAKKPTKRKHPSLGRNNKDILNELAWCISVEITQFVESNDQHI